MLGTIQRRALAGLLLAAVQLPVAEATPMPRSPPATCTLAQVAYYLRWLFGSYDNLFDPGRLPFPIPFPIEQIEQILPPGVLPPGVLNLPELNVPERQPPQRSPSGSAGQAGRAPAAREEQSSRQPAKTAPKAPPQPSVPAEPVDEGDRGSPSPFEGLIR